MKYTPFAPDRTTRETTKKKGKRHERVRVFLILYFVSLLVIIFTLFYCGRDGALFKLYTSCIHTARAFHQQKQEEQQRKDNATTNVDGSTETRSI